MGGPADGHDIDTDLMVRPMARPVVRDIGADRMVHSACWAVSRAAATWGACVPLRARDKITQLIPARDEEALGFV